MGLSGGKDKPPPERGEYEYTRGESAGILQPPSPPDWSIGSVPAGGVLVVGHPGSPHVVPLMLFGLKHMGPKYAFQTCDIIKGEQLSSDFLAVNPFHQVPSAKAADGTCLYEHCAALRWLAGRYAPQTYPPAKRLAIDIAMAKRQNDLYRKVWTPIGYYAMQLMGAAPPGASAAGALNDVLARLLTAFFDDDLGLDSSMFVGGDEPSIADYSIVPLIHTLSLPTVRRIGYELPPRWQQYLSDMRGALGECYDRALAVHTEWISSNEAKVANVDFTPYSPQAALTVGGGAWQTGEPPAGGVLVLGHPGSGNVVPVMLFGLKYMGEKYAFQMCDIMKGEQMSPDFLAVNPFHQVPAAKAADGTCMYEHCAMLRWLAERYAPGAYPEAQRLTIDIALDKRNGDLYQAWMPIGYYAMQLPSFPTSPTKDQCAKLDAVLRTMADAFLPGRARFVAACTELSIADLSIVPLIHTLTTPTVREAGYALPERWARYHADVREALGEACFQEATRVHTTWVTSNLDKVRASTR